MPQDTKNADLNLPLTDRNVAGLPLASAGQYRARDVELRGFFLMVGIKKKTFMIQADLAQAQKRQSIRMTVGAAAAMSARDARNKAKSLLAEIAAGKDPRVEPPKRGRPSKSDAPTPKGEGPTLGAAWNRYLVSHLRRKGRSQQTIDNYTDHIERLLVDWREVPLMELGADPLRVANRHDLISQAHGPAIANGAMRTFRAVYNHARKTFRALPAENPVYAVDWNTEKRRDTALGLRDLPDWFEQLVKLENPVRREFHLLCLLSGSRPEAVKVVRLEHIDLRLRTLEVPAPKGGEEKAYVIPLSRRMIECIIRALRFGQLLFPEQSQTWLFPSESASGHMAEHKEDRQSILSHWGMDLRQTYRTLGQPAGVPEVDIHLLMNHAIQGVNIGYITRSKLMSDHLRLQQDRLSDLMIGAVVGKGRRPSSDLSRWLNTPSRAQVEALLNLDPDEIRERFSARSPMRRLEVQAARMAYQGLPSEVLDPPSRRLKGVRTPQLRSSSKWNS